MVVVQHAGASATHDLILGLSELIPVDVNVRGLHLLEPLHGLPQHDRR